ESLWPKHMIYQHCGLNIMI
ncbi:hypothetical protein AZ018_002631, partial [Klebsiella pneumoniae]